MSRTAQTPLSSRPRPIYFASGSQHPGEIRGFAAIGQPIGIAADQCRGACERTLKQVARTRLPVFVDSGAFGEIEFGPKGPYVVKPISDAEWKSRLALYDRLADVMGPQMYAVAPDKVGFQGETLKRLRRYREEVRELRRKGVHILVPFQGGRMSLREFDRKVQDALGFDDYVVAFPMKKGATDPRQIAAFLKYRKPAAVHLLGLGAQNRTAPKILEIIETLSPKTRVTLDSNKLKAYVGWEYDEYVKRMERVPLEPMPKAEWVPSHHLLLPGFRSVPELTPREYTLAREFVGPLRPRFSTELGQVRPEALGLEVWGVDVLGDDAMLEQVDTWMSRRARKELMRQRTIADAWDAYVDGVGPRPPENPSIPIADVWPAPDEEDAAEFMASPHGWIQGQREPGDMSYWAAALRPMYLDYLGSQRVNGSTVATTWRKERAVHAAFGEGPIWRQFQEWKRMAKAVTTQRDYEMQLAMAYEMQPEIIVSDAELDLISRAMDYPEYEELRLRHWKKIPAWMHWEWELRRAGQVGTNSAYYKWVQDVLRTLPAPQQNRFLRELTQMRVAERQGLRADAPRLTIRGKGSALPRAAHARQLREYREPETDLEFAPGQRVANPSPSEGYTRGVRAIRQVAMRRRRPNGAALTRGLLQ